MGDRLVKPLLLVAPTRSEYSAVRAAVADLLASGRVQLEMCGMGPKCAAAFCHRLEEGVSAVRGLALVGWAGGLSPDLVAGDTVLANATLGVGGECAPCTLVPLPQARVGSLLSTPGVLLTAADKADAHRKSGGALAVEMEAYPLATWARKWDIPFIHARVILDPAGQTLPSLADILGPTGELRPGRLAQRVLAQPGQFLTLLHFVRRSQALAPVLGSLARAVVLTMQRA
jgi:hypothetical protein